MKRFFVGICLFGVGACDFFTSAPECNGNVGYVAENLTEWMQGYLSDGYSVKVVGVNDFYELKESPLLLGTTLYDNVKGGTLCSATAKIVVSDKDGKKFTDEIDVRYQLLTTIPNENGEYMTGIRMSGHDAGEMRDALNEKIIRNF